MDAPVPSFLLQNQESKPGAVKKSYGFGFLDKTIRSAAGFVMHSHAHWYLANKKGFLQQIDPRAKVLFLAAYVILVSFLNTIAAQLMVFAVVFLLHIFSKLNIWDAYKKIAVISFLFGFLIFLPSSLNLFNKGEHILNLIKFSGPQKIWIYNIPQEIAITKQGMEGVMRLTLKVANSVSIVLLIVSVSTFEKLIRALSYFRVPAIFLLILTLSYKFIFILSHTIQETYQALKMRWWNRGSVTQAEAMVAGRIGYLFRKSWERYEQVYISMTARGFKGEVRFCYFEPFKLADCLFLFFIGIVLVLIVVLNLWYV
jgi:cobalt ECF transporter T component CbiQ